MVVNLNLESGIRYTSQLMLIFMLPILQMILPFCLQPSFRLNLKQGEQIASYGFAYGNDLASFTMGNVTSVVGLDNNTSAFQISAPVQPRNSGGPLLDMNGRVIGMAQGILGTLRAAEALGGSYSSKRQFRYHCYYDYWVSSGF